MDIETLKKSPVWYKNCKRQRKVEAKICQDCPFRAIIEVIEVLEEWDAEYCNEDVAIW
jgi:DNA modification methylase